MSLRLHDRDVGPVAFRRALGRCAAGVVVVTVADGPTGLTISSFTSVSLRPPLVSFYVDRRSASWPRLAAAEAFAVNVLAVDQAAVAARFAAGGVDRFAEPTRWYPGPGALPLLGGAAQYLLCRPYATLGVGDHWLVVGLIETVLDGTGAGPLLYHAGGYGHFEAG
jgi:flavin reductase (DIM6/NTAB) family NADH-FMN oxidoreductase RutF